MRRNRDYGNVNAQMSSGPLLTTHLRDLDIELELLKRKRDIIQQEQAILSRYPNKRQYNNYEEPHNLYNRQGPTNQQFNNQNFSNRYDGPSGSGNFTRPQGTKRQAPVKNWQGSNQKRFATPQKTINPWQNSNAPKQDQGFPNRKSFQPQPLIITSQPRPLMSIRPSIGQKLQKNFPTQRKDFRPTKVTKPKNQPPKKNTTYPIEETKKLVSQAQNVLKKVEPDMILRADKPPSVQVKGRMELALGTLMKEIKTENCSDPVDLEFFQTPFIQRILKQTIRTRIRNVMLDQVVGHVNDVVIRYRKKFPKDTDLELVKIAKDAQSLSSKKAGVVQLIESDDPQEFYKKNMMKVLGSKLEEMLSNLEKLYLNPKKDLTEFVDKMPEPKKQTEDEKAETVDESNPTAKERTTYENIIGECGDPKAFQQKLEKVKMYVEFMDELVEQRLPKILPKFKDMMLSILYTDKEVLSMKALLTSQLKKKLTKVLEKSTLVEPNATESEKSESIFASDEVIFSTSTNSADTSMDVDSIKKEEDAKSAHGKEQEEATKSSAKPVDEGKQQEVEKPSQKSADEEKKEVKPIVNVVAVATPVSTPAKPKVTSTPNTPVTDMYFAKLISRPNLPARAVIYEFLNQFKPTSIKKHKTVSNLLVIGFKDKENYEKILKVNETTIGDSQIIIRPSEQITKTTSTPSQNKETPSTPKSTDTSLADDSLISSDLDNQITDLLTCIRQANESEDEKKMDTSQDNSNSNQVAAKNDEKVETNGNSNVNEAQNDQTNDNTESTEQFKTKNDAEEIDNARDNDTNAKAKTQEENLESNRNDASNDENKLESQKTELETIVEANTEEKPKQSTPEKVKDLKESGRNTPTRASSRLASVTPSTIRTRRASRLAQNN